MRILYTNCRHHNDQCPFLSSKNKNDWLLSLHNSSGVMTPTLKVWSRHLIKFIWSHLFKIFCTMGIKIGSNILDTGRSNWQGHNLSMVIKTTHSFIQSHYWNTVFVRVVPILPNIIPAKPQLSGIILNDKENIIYNPPMKTAFSHYPHDQCFIFVKFLNNMWKKPLFKGKWIWFFNAEDVERWLFTFPLRILISNSFPQPSHSWL